FDLALGADGIDDCAAVRGDYILEDFDLSRFGVDVNLGGLRPVIVGAGLVAKAGTIGQYGIGIETTRTDNRRAVVTEQPRARDVGNSYRLAFSSLDENFAIARDEILRIGFQHFARLLEKLLLDIGSRVLNRVAAHIGKPAGERTYTKSREIRVGAGNLDIFDPHAKFFSSDLPHRCVTPLATFT